VTGTRRRKGVQRAAGALRQLAMQDRLTRPDRSRRYQFLKRTFGPDRDMLFFGGLFAAQAYQEALACYIDACFVACVVLCQIVLEHTLAGVFKVSGREDLDGAGFFRLLREAEAAGMLRSDEVQAFNEMRQLRNQYIHAGDGGMDWLLKRRSKHPTVFDALEEDATLMLKALRRIRVG